MAYRNRPALEPRGNCSRWLPDPNEAGRYAWPACASLARAFAQRRSVLAVGTGTRSYEEAPHV